MEANPGLQRALDICSQQKDLTCSTLGELEKQMVESAGKIEQEHQNWLPNFSGTKQKYEDAVREDKGDYKALDQRRAKLTVEKEALARNLSQSQSLVDGLKEITEKRDDKLKQLAEAYTNYLRDRLSKCKKFEDDSRGKLSVSIKPSTNVDEFKSRLTAMKRGTYLSDDEIQKICSTMPPKDFILQILRFDTVKNLAHLKPIVEKTSVAVEKVDSNFAKGAKLEWGTRRNQDGAPAEMKVTETRCRALLGLDGSETRPYTVGGWAVGCQ